MLRLFKLIFVFEKITSKLNSDEIDFNFQSEAHLGTILRV
jgi:hypothetical protein